MRAGREAELAHGQLERTLAGLVQPADLPREPRRKLRIVVPSLPLDAARHLEASAQRDGSLVFQQREDVSEIEVDTEEPEHPDDQCQACSRGNDFDECLEVLA